MKISNREKEVLHLIAQEYTTNEIAQQLYISSHTVISHRKNLLWKMDARNVAGLVRRGFEKGILSVSSNIAMTICLLLSICLQPAKASKENFLANVNEIVSVQTVIYVDNNASLGGDGTSWAAAYKYLQDALSDARSNASSFNNHEIWVAEGTYYPDDDEAGNFTDNDQNSAFTMMNYTEILGGFQGNETSKSQRNWGSNETILSGDIVQNGSGKAYNIFNNTFTDRTALTSTAVLDGFIIEKGKHTTSASTSGGGAMYNQYSFIRVKNCIFRSNESSSTPGGAVFNEISDSKFENCLFYENRTAYTEGHAFYNDRSNPTLINCTLSDNEYSLGDFGIVNNSSSSLTILNCILWNNDTEIKNIGTSSTSITNSIVEGNYTGTNVNNEDPLFKNSSINDYTLTECSPAINSGITNGVTVNLDLNHNPRVHANLIDIGAFEFNTIHIVYVDSSQTTLNTNGFTWGGAHRYLQDGLSSIPDCRKLKTEVWIAKGTYYPDEGGGQVNDDRDASFSMLNNVEIYGGFTGNETLQGQRDWVKHKTILSGDIDQNDHLGDTTSNAKNIILNIYTQDSMLSNSAILDGFIIQGGYGKSNFGSALRNIYSSPIIRNTIFRNNLSDRGGAVSNAFYSSAEFINCQFLNNRSYYFGGAMIIGLNSNVLIDQCIFEANVCDTTNIDVTTTTAYELNSNDIIQGEGGAISAASTNDSVVITNSTFSNNFSRLKGGAIESSGYLQISNSLFDGNISWRGGAIHHLGSNDSLDIENCDFTNNLNNSWIIYNTPLNPDPIDHAGAIYIADCNSSIRNSLFENNTSTYWGGGLYYKNGIHNVDSTIFDNNKSEVLYAGQAENQYGGAVYIDGDAKVDIDRCTFFDNQSVDGGGGIFFDTDYSKISSSLFYDNLPHSLNMVNSSAADIINCTFTATNENPFNGVAINNAASPNFYNSIFYGGGTSVTDQGGVLLINCLLEPGTEFSNGSNILYDDPQFVNPSTFDFRLANNSPAIDFGDNAHVNKLLDLSNNPRIDVHTNQVDLGAYEYTTVPTRSLNCPNSRTLAGEITSGNYKTASSLQCIGFIASGSNVILSAPDSIIFNDAFEVKNNAALETNSEGCQN